MLFPHSPQLSSGPSIDANVFLADPILASLPRAVLARLIPSARQLSLADGDVLFENEQSGENVYLLIFGAVVLKNSLGSSFIVHGGLLGTEIALGADAYPTTAHASGEVTVLALSARSLRQAATVDADVRRCLIEAATYTPSEKSGLSPKAPFLVINNKRIALGWVLMLVAPVFVYFISQNTSTGISTDAAYLLAILTATVILWLLNLVPAFVPPLFTMTAAILLDIVPIDTAVSGFGSGSFFMMVGIFAVSGVMVASGLTFRLSILVLRWVPPTPLWYGFVLFLIGCLLSPVLPSQGGRMAIILPFLSDLMRTCRLQPKDRSATLFVASTLTGVGTLSSVFLTGKPSNLVVLGVMDTQTQSAFQWLHWLEGSLVAGLVMILFYVLAARFVFANPTPIVATRDTAKDQLKVLGRPSLSEFGALFVVAALFVGMTTTQFHRIPIPWIALTCMVAILILRGLDPQELRGRIDWATVLFVGAIIGWVPMMQSVGLDAFLVHQLDWLGRTMRTDFFVFLGLLSVLILVARLVLPEIVTTIVLVSALFPVAEAAGISTWVIGFVVLTLGESFVFPYQMPYHLQLDVELEHEGLSAACDRNRLLLFNALMSAGRVVAVFASVAVWKWMDII